MFLVLAVAGCDGTTTSDDPTDITDTTDTTDVTDQTDTTDQTTDTGDTTTDTTDDDPTTDTTDTETNPNCWDVDLGLAVPQTWTGGTVDKRDDFVGSCGGTGFDDLAFRFQAPNDGRFGFDVTNATRMDTVMYALTNCDGTGTELACVDDTEFGGEALILDMLAGEEVIVVVDGGRSYVELNVVAAEDNETGCRDQVDSDIDRLVDCQDPDCWAAPECAEDCGNGRDDNDSGAIDCADPVCLSDPNCFEDCDNGVDDNRDDVFDCDDAIQCGSDPVCQPGCPDVTTSDLPAVLTGDTRGDPDDITLSCGSTLTGDVQIEYTATVTGDHFIDTVGSDFDIAFSVADGCGATATELVCVADSFGGRNAQAVVPMTAGNTYIINVDSDGGAEGNYQINIDPFTGTETSCSDGRDTDNDGLIDCADRDCWDDVSCELSYNLLDDEPDGQMDCADSSCTPDVEPLCGEDCSSGFDEDRDGFINCNDSDCASDDICSSGTCADLFFEPDADEKVFFRRSNIGLPNDSTSGCGSSSGGDFTVEFTAPSAGDYVFETLKTSSTRWTSNTSTVSQLNTIISVRDDCPGAGNELECNDNRNGNHGTLSQVVVSLNAGETVYAEYQVAGSSEGHIDGAIVPKESSETSCNDGADNDADSLIDCNDSDCSGTTACSTGAECPAMVIGITPDPIRYDTSTRPNDHSLTCAFNGSAGDMTFEFTAPEAGTYVFNTFGSNYDTALMVYDECQGSVLACNDDTSGFGLDSQVTITLDEDETVVIVATGYSSGEGLGVLNMLRLP